MVINSPKSTAVPAFDQAKITQLLRDNKIAEAKQYLSSVIETTVGAENSAAVFAQYAHVYMQIMNSINARYLQSLERVQDIISDIHTGEQKTDHLLRIAELKANL